MTKMHPRPIFSISKQLLSGCLIGIAILSLVWILPAQAQVAPEWQKKVDAKDTETLLEEQRLEAYRKNIPEIFRRAKEALEKRDKATYRKNLALLKQTLDYMDKVFRRKYAPWFTPEYFDDTYITPDKTPITPLTPLGMAEAYRYGPIELERQRKHTESEQKAEALSDGAKKLEKEGLLKPGSADELEDDLAKWKKISEEVSFIKKAAQSCDPKTITKALSLLEHYYRISFKLEQIYSRQLLRAIYTAAEREEIRRRRDNQRSIQDEQIDLKKQLEEKLKACPPETKKPTEQNALPNSLGSYQSTLKTFEQMAWSTTSKPISSSGELPPPVPRSSVPLAGEFIMVTPSPSAMESGPTNTPVQTAIRQMCEMLVTTYRQNLMATVDQGWRAPKPPQKGVYIAKFSYGIQHDGGLYLPSNSEAIQMVQSSGYARIDESARARIYELFGPGAPTAEAGGYKRPLPSCFTEPFLRIDHTFQVIYR